MNIKTKLESVLNIRKKKKQHILKDEPKREQVYCMSVLCGSMCGGTKLKDHKDKFCQDDVSGSGGDSLYFIVLNYIYTYVFNDVSFVCLSCTIGRLFFDVPIKSQLSTPSVGMVYVSTLVGVHTSRWWWLILTTSTQK